MKVITLNKAIFSKKCSELFSKLDIEPDLVIGILNGGGYVMEEYRNYKPHTSAFFQTVAIKRNNNLKRNYIAIFLLKILPYNLLNMLRIYESEKADKSIKKLKDSNLMNIKLGISLDFLSNESIKNILIVDDAIDTGKTMLIVKNNLQKIFPKTKISTAVISWTIERSIVKPDYYLYENALIRFPWSIDYKGKDFEKKSFSS
ncbi:MAG: hypothetical protein HKO81_08005 [Flavobacteriaceae bacterium]|nr:hypothetical protein [Flavobacteriaceae bacterium]